MSIHDIQNYIMAGLTFLVGFVLGVSVAFWVMGW